MIKATKQTDKAQEEKLKPAVQVRTHNQTDGTYCLILEIADGHITSSSFPYDHRKGSHTEVNLWDLTPENLKTLGQNIIAEAIKIEMGIE